jgi:hypothetical protein
MKKRKKINKGIMGLFFLVLVLGTGTLLLFSGFNFTKFLIKDSNTLPPDGNVSYSFSLPEEQFVRINLYDISRGGSFKTCLTNFNEYERFRKGKEYLCLGGSPYTTSEETYGNLPKGDYVYILINLVDKKTEYKISITKK